ncbi:MAG: hypothetical protein ACO3K7_04000 [Candidatus Marinamargulisbacteria bacterium]
MIRLKFVMMAIMVSLFLASCSFKKYATYGVVSFKIYKVSLD